MGVRHVTRWAVVLLVGGLVLSAVLFAYAQSGVPEDIAAYRSWTKMNTILLADPSNPRAGPKNTFTNLSPDELRTIVGIGARVKQPFPDGTVIVRETLNPTEGWVSVLFVMRKDSKAGAKWKGWVFTGFSRTAADKPYAPLEIADPFMRCLACHTEMRASDYVFTPFTNRPDPLPARAPIGPNQIAVFNYQFGPQDLHVKVGTTIVWTNYDTVPHDVKAADRSIESGNIPTQGRFFFTATKPGTTEYFCSIHLGMRGRVIVEP